MLIYGKTTLLMYLWKPSISIALLVLKQTQRSIFKRRTILRMEASSPLQLHALIMPDNNSNNTNPVDDCDGWKELMVQDLIHVGVALLDVRAAATGGIEESLYRIPAAAFASTAAALDLLGGKYVQQPDPATAGAAAADDEATLGCCPVIQASADSAHATGYHRAGSMSARYNAYREGFVFSDGQDITVEACPSFQTDCAALCNLLHATADQVLTAICCHLHLPTASWFQEQMGPIVDNSQWHVKRYVTPPPSCDDNEDGDDTVPSVECLLPTHTDPSLISIVMLHRPGIQKGAAGLQYATVVAGASDRTWVEIPYSGHAVAIVLVGSVLQHVTGGYFTACKHRVVAAAAAATTTTITTTGAEETREARMAATLFVRPAPHALLFLPPSPVLADRRSSGRSNNKRLTFQQWNAKTARNYERAKMGRPQQQEEETR